MCVVSLCVGPAGCCVSRFMLQGCSVVQVRRVYIENFVGGY